MIHDRQERPTTGIESGRIDVQAESNQRELGQMRPIEDLLLEVEQVQVAGLALATIRTTVKPKLCNEIIMVRSRLVLCTLLKCVI